MISVIEVFEQVFPSFILIGGDKISSFMLLIFTQKRLIRQIENGEDEKKSCEKKTDALIECHV